MRNKLLILLMGLLLALPVLAWGQVPDDRDSIIIETRSIAAGLTGTPSTPAVEVLVYVSNKDSASYMVVNCTTRTISGSGYALLSRTAGNLLTFGSIVHIVNAYNFGGSFNTAAVAGYDDSSPDAFLVAGGGDGVDPGTNLPPSASPQPVWALRFRATSAGPGEMLINPDARVSAQPGSYLTNTRAIDVVVNKVSGILSVTFPFPDNPLPGNQATIDAGAAFNYTFTSSLCSNFSLVSGPGSISPSGAYSVSGLCGGTYPVTIQADCGTAGMQPYSFTINVTPVPPTAICPANAQIQMNQPYSAQASASGGVGPYTFALVSGPAGLTVSPSGLVEWTPGATGGFDVTISATDACGLSGECTYRLTVVRGEMFRLVIENVTGALGADVNVPIVNQVEATDPDLANGSSIGGFSFLVSYDCGALTFLGASQGAALYAGWEFFTYRLGTCQVRIAAIADVNNGAAHPVITRTNMGEWAVMRYRVIGDAAFAGQCIPVRWWWHDCTDNTVSDSTGNTLWVVNSLMGPDGVTPISLAGFDSDVSNCDAYSGGFPGDPSPKKFINYRDGQVCIPQTPPPPDGGVRGDINLNGLPYEVADANLFESYFIYGPSVWSSDPFDRARQIAATDINGDGATLTIADLVMLIRIITGDMEPLPRMNPAAGVVSLALNSSGSQWTLAANSASDLGGLYLKFKVEGEIGNVVLSGAASGMTLKSNLAGDELSVLIYSETKGQMILPNAGAIVKMDVDGSVELVQSEAADYYGIALPTLTKASALPSAFALSQNYPNPFNGKTSLVLALPVASDYTVTVYNVTGQVVKTFEGSAPAGNRTIVWDGTDSNGKAVSSGIYFFKAAAGSYSSVVKGLYLK